MSKTTHLPYPIILCVALAAMTLACNDNDSSDDSDGTAEPFATALWNGEEIEFDNISCTAMGAETHQLSAESVDGDTHLILIWVRPFAEARDEPDGDADLNDLGVQMTFPPPPEADSDQHIRYHMFDGEFDVSPDFGRLDDDEFIEVSGTAEMRPRSDMDIDVELEDGVVEFEAGC